MPIYRELRGVVSLYALNKVNEELKMTHDILAGLLENACEYCIRATHGLPCAHELYEFQIKGKHIPLDCIVSHWRMLSMEYGAYS